MKKTMKKILALVLTMLMLLSVAAPVFANNAVACPEVHSKKNLDEKGITYKFISEHKPERCSDQSYNVYQCNACGVYFADDIVLSGKLCDFEITKPATCTEKGTQKCKVCGYEEEIAMVPHDYVPDKTCGYDGEDVTWTCSVCGDKKVEPFDGNHTFNITVTLEPTCNTKGNAHYVCTICGFEKDVEIKADANHIGHNWVYGEAQEGKCFVDGSTKPHITAGYYCADCGVAAEAGQIIVVNGEEVVNTSKYTVTEVEHKIDYSKPTVQPATCDEYGFKFYACGVCTYFDKDATEIIPKLPHTYNKANLTHTEVPCSVDAEGKTVPGKDVYTGKCEVCNKDIEIVEVHDVTFNVKVEANCTTDGRTYDNCSKCGELNTRDEVKSDSAEHVYWATEQEAANANYADEYGIQTDATCTATGIYYTTCKHCHNAYKTGTIPAKNHTYTEEVDCLNGKVIYTCSVCGDKYEEAIPGFDFNDITFHADWDAVSGTWTGLKDFIAGATCETPEITIYECSYCNAKADTKTNIVVIGDIAHNWVVVDAPVTGDCVTDGHVGYWECANCDATKGTAGADGVIKHEGHKWNAETEVKEVLPTCTEAGSYAWRQCTVCGTEEGSKADRPALDHDINLIIDDNPNGNQGINNFTCEKYTYNHYGCTRCNDKTTEYWVNYVAATGHNMEVTTEPTCTTKGYETCTNAWCDGCEPNELPILKHIDENEKVIECVSEDFYCYRCCEPKFDAEDKFTGEYTKDKLSWKESHYDVAVTIVNGICTEYHYELNVCKKCEKEWMDTNIILPDHDRVNAYWVETTPATFDAPGVESLICGRPGCNYVLETREFTRKDVEFSFEFDSAVYAGAHLVNSGYLAVKVNLSAYERDIHSVNFSFTVDASVLTLKEIIVPENSVFYNMVFASHDVANNNRINVYGTVQNEVNSTEIRNVKFTGTTEFATLIFKIADNANTEANYQDSDYTNDYAVTNIAAIECGVNYINYAASTPDNLAIVPYEGKRETLVDFATFNGALTIHMLGDVNLDGERNANKVATAIDVDTIRALIAENRYVAEADINKDGAITVFDFEYLAQYLVGEFGYADLCAKS